MLNNPFVRAVGVAAIAYLIFRSLAWAMFALANIAQSFAYWLKWNFLPWSEEIAVGIGVAFLVFVAVTTSKEN